MSLTPERARELLAYEPKTGTLLWNVNRKGSVKAGDVAGSRQPNGYLKVRVDGSDYLCHRLAWLIVHGRWPSAQLDHINGEPNDNRLDNLREATNAENHQNLGRFSSNTSGHTGVTWSDDRKKWVAQIHVAGKRKCLGYFDDKDAAARKYSEPKAAMHPFSPIARA